MDPCNHCGYEPDETNDGDTYAANLECQYCKNDDYCSECQSDHEDGCQDNPDNQ